jgi:hypothetical protein
MSQKGEIQGFLALLGDFYVLSGKDLRGGWLNQLSLTALRVRVGDLLSSSEFHWG